jgi:NAD(P)-dependent dehydrogenase (short-subunit alcohol dehydrogenase family)
MEADKPVVLITGALRGIGRATAIAFARNGARLVACGHMREEQAAAQYRLRPVETGLFARTS